MHSHAVAPESSGAFFLDMGTERCVFQAGGLRNALRASEAVRATDVMVNSSTLWLLLDDKKNSIIKQHLTKKHIFINGLCLFFVN